MVSPSLLPIAPTSVNSALRKSAWSDSGTPSKSAMINIANGFANAPMNSQLPPPSAATYWRSASRQMNSSFSLRRFGVIIRDSRARCAVCTGGSNVGSWSKNGISSRCAAINPDTSASPKSCSGTGKPGKGPVTEMHDANRSVSL